VNEVIMEKQAMEKKFEDNHNLQTKMNINPKNDEEIIKINFKNCMLKESYGNFMA
jgi:hypothetical protein